MTASSFTELYGEHADLLKDCVVDVYTDGTSCRHVTLRHQPTGLSVSASGTSDILTKREALTGLADLLGR